LNKLEAEYQKQKTAEARLALMMAEDPDKIETYTDAIKLSEMKRKAMIDGMSYIKSKL